MRTLIFAILCLAAGIAAADSNQVVVVRVLEVKERMQTLELIDVSAEKSEAPDAEPLEAELRAILDEAELLEVEEADEES